MYDDINTFEPEEIEPQPIPVKRKSGCLSRISKFILIVLVIWWFNNYTLKTTKVTIKSDKIENKVKIAVLSDLHAKKIAIGNNTIIKSLNKENPDFVCILGDMHSSDASEEEKQISLDLMTDIVNEGYKVYFVLGEHDDRRNIYIDNMELNGINVLDYETNEITVKNNKIKLYGISNAYFSPTFDLNNEFSQPKDDSFNILLAHIPRYSDYEAFGADLTICGDTHGGVIQIPFLGPAYYEGKWLPELSENSKTVYDKGLFSYEGGNMFITSGIGNYPLPVRFNNRPEIAIMTIESK